jgi:lipid-A-disaccharide synthase
MLAKRPMVVAYRLAASTYRLVMALGMMKITRYSLPNVLANEPIVPELMQGQCTAENLERALLDWFENAEARSTLEPRYLAIHQRLRGDASAAAAAAVAQLLERPR